jgi:hypothetical protein
MIYIIKCLNEKYYVGYTTNLEKRLEQHFNGKGSEWTKLYKPVELYKKINSCDDFDELKYTLETMSEYGIDNVRGSCFVKPKLSIVEKEIISKMLKYKQNTCFNCNGNHYTKDCNICCRICCKKGHYSEDCKLIKLTTV